MIGNKLEMIMQNLFNKNFFLRIFSGTILGSITTFCLWKGSFYFSIFILTVAIISYLEWFTIVANNLGDKEFSEYKSYMMGWGIAGLILILPCAISITYLRYTAGFEKILYLILTIISTDIGAFIFGKIIGGPKLAPSISPGKTMSGSVSGIIVAILTACILKITGVININYQALIICTLILSIVSQVGDLIESGFKRHFGVKDSSNLIPGHGGFLDRIDSFLLTAPAFMIMQIMGFFV
jgi:CDP-diglyceride synthetase